MELLLATGVDTVMGHLNDFTVRLVGRDSRADCITLLAETAVIAIYRAATLAREAGAVDFEILQRPRRIRVFA
jgi:hypothetical protein